MKESKPIDERLLATPIHLAGLVKGRSFGSPLARGLKPRASTA